MKKTMQLTLVVAALQLAGVATPVAVFAQVAPDAGTSLELLRRQPQPLPLGPALTVPEREMTRTLGGQAVQIRSVALQAIPGCPPSRCSRRWGPVRRSRSR